MYVYVLLIKELIGISKLHRFLIVRYFDDLNPFIFHFLFIRFTLISERSYSNMKVKIFNNRSHNL